MIRNQRRMEKYAIVEEEMVPPQYSCLKNPMDRRAWQAIALGIAESDRTDDRAHLNPE